MRNEFIKIVIFSQWHHFGVKYIEFILTKMMVSEIFILKFWIQPFPCHERAKQFKERDQLNVTSGSHTCDAKEKDATRHSSLIYCSMGRLPKYLWPCFLNFSVSITFSWSEWFRNWFQFENMEKIPIGMFFDLHAKLEIDTV